MSPEKPGPSNSSRKSCPTFARTCSKSPRSSVSATISTRCSAAKSEAQAAFGQRATANRSQPYYLDVTNKDANKGAVVEYLSQHVGVPAEEIATIGDQPNDVLMFKRSGFSIAMGNASDEVKAEAAAVTASYNDEGFAKAMEAFILGSARQ